MDFVVNGKSAFSIIGGVMIVAYDKVFNCFDPIKPVMLHNYTLSTGESL